VSSVDKAKNKAQEAKGHVKEAVGKATDDQSLEAEGKGDKVAGNLPSRRCRRALNPICDSTRGAIPFVFTSFSREYWRMFGVPPSRDALALREAAALPPI
jgi:uncharacterized protein YjbJ (UPF0337 family)